MLKNVLLIFRRILLCRNQNDVIPKKHPITLQLKWRGNRLIFTTNLNKGGIAKKVYLLPPRLPHVLIMKFHHRSIVVFSPSGNGEKEISRISPVLLQAEGFCTPLSSQKEMKRIIRIITVGLKYLCIYATPPILSYPTTLLFPE